MNLKSRLVRLEGTSGAASQFRPYRRVIADPRITGHAERAEAEAADLVASGFNISVRRIVEPVT